MLQNHILLFLKKAFIAFPFLLGSICLVAPQIALSAAIETSQFDIDPFPIHPTVSGALYLDVTKKGECDLFDVRFTSATIDPVNRQIQVGFDLPPFSGGNDPCHSRFLVTDNLPSSGEYQIFVFDFSTGVPHQLGPIILTVASAAPIPTLSEWMLILMALIVLFIATREIQKNNVQINKGI